mgnify:CR=1 FL=1
MSYELKKIVYLQKMNVMFNKNIFLIIYAIFIVLSCNRFKPAQSDFVSFSTDTVFFDTIFTQIGSTTIAFMVYNKHNYPVKINKIFLNGNPNSKFRINVDGVSQNTVEDVIIDAQDSIFIFVEVTINPGKDSLLVEDSITFLSGNNRQSVILTAFGKDVHLIKSQTLTTQTWVNDKAYLIYNYAYVDSGQTLTIEPGAELYFHYNSGLYVAGTLVANGTFEKPISFKGDRIDNQTFYKDKPGQWNGVFFLPSSSNNILNYLNLKESVYGIYVDSALNTNYPKLIINNSQINRCSRIGLCFINSYVIVLNTIVSDCFLNNLAMFNSGNYEFYHCTIQNDYSFAPRNSPSLGIKNYLNINNKITYGNITALFFNTIIYGNNENEFVVDAYTNGNISLILKNCLVKVKNSDTIASFFQNCIFNKDPEYKDKYNLDYRLKNNSPAINKGFFDIVQNNQSLLRFDMNNTDRLADQMPDIGAIEYKQTD